MATRNGRCLGSRVTIASPSEVYGMSCRALLCSGLAAESPSLRSLDLLASLILTLI